MHTPLRPSFVACMRHSIREVKIDIAIKIEIEIRIQIQITSTSTITSMSTVKTSKIEIGVLGRVMGGHAAG